MNYEQALFFLQELTKFGFNLGLDRIEELMQRLDNPHLRLKVVHVGGTNGKGSTVAIASQILQKAGYRVGVFTSPHLHSYTERYRINDRYITEEEMANYITILKPHLEQMVQEGFEHPTEFEVCTAMAFLYFAREDVDFVLLEVGMGGAIDSTNIVIPMISVITNVAMDHMDYLGNTIKEIASVKAGIIKTKGIAVTAVQHPEALEEIHRQSREREACLIEVYKEASWTLRNTTLTAQIFDLRTSQREYPELKLGLIGSHQIINAATAVVTIEKLEELGIEVGVQAIREGLAAVTWPARLEILRQKPLVVLDGAHNVHGAESLAEALKNVFTYDKLTLVFGMLGDKERGKVVQILAPLADRVIVTKPNSPRAGEWEKVADEVKNYVNCVTINDDIHGAVREAIEQSGGKDLVCITGSLYMVAEAREYFL